MPLLQGIDIVDVEKISGILARHGDFASDLFTEAEVKSCNSSPNPPLLFSRRFAAKEAVLKALGMGMSGLGIDASFREIEILPDEAGLRFHGWIGRLIKKRGVTGWRLSTSSAGGHAVAVVVLFG